jgi:hypothetical protein
MIALQFQFSNYSTDISEVVKLWINLNIIRRCNMNLHAPEIKQAIENGQVNYVTIDWDN